MKTQTRGQALDQALTRATAAAPSRRRLLGLMIGSLLGLPLVTNEVLAKRKKRRKKNKKAKPCGVCQTLQKGKCRISPDFTPCGTDSVCLDGACVCPSGQRECQDGCISAAACCVDSDCPAESGAVCRDGDCGCPPGQEASGSVCAARPTCAGRGDACGSDANCCGGLCIIGSDTCFFSGRTQPCLDDNDCSIGLTCVGFKCAAA
jgi:hypothetical protein